MLRPGHDYVLIGRRAALGLPFGEMVQELDAALGRVHAAAAGRTGGASPAPYMRRVRRQSRERRAEAEATARIARTARRSRGESIE